MRILIAEDQPTSALLLRRLLERMGHEVLVAPDGVEAWQILDDDNDFPLVISDWVMPQMDGLELCRRIRSRGGGRYTYVILLTSKDRREDRLDALRAGADDFLIKPPVPEELEIRLEVAGRILKVHEELMRQNARLAELATTDGLTGVKNRRRFREDLELHFSFSSRHGLPLSLVMLDVDHFKQYNDTFGHPAGDDILRAFAGVLRDTVREQDIVARYGGEEFIILLPNTDTEPALTLAERLRFGITAQPWPLRPITASVGVATTTAQTLGPDHLIEQADRALYHSKRSGRNRVTHTQFLDALDEPTSTCSLAGEPRSARAALQVS